MTCKEYDKMNLRAFSLPPDSVEREDLFHEIYMHYDVCPACFSDLVPGSKGISPLSYYMRKHPEAVLSKDGPRPTGKPMLPKRHVPDGECPF